MRLKGDFDERLDEWKCQGYFFFWQLLTKEKMGVIIAYIHLLLYRYIVFSNKSKAIQNNIFAWTKIENLRIKVATIIVTNIPNNLISREHALVFWFCALYVYFDFRF